ncbi:MAG: hypothetical protein NT091_01935, partial [Candidatus Falkowbacteria bacterium]|nr:hypothetical protein [Candidatus Falkowbacteria bacterium]
MLWLIELMIHKYGGLDGLKRDFANFNRPFIYVLVLSIPFNLFPWADLRWLNFVLFFLVNIMHLVVWTKPRILMKLAGLAYIAGAMDKDRGFQDYVVIFKDVIAKILFFASMFLLIMAIVPFRNNPVSIVFVLAGATTLFWMGIVNGEENSSLNASILWLSRRFVVMVLVGGGFLTVIPEELYV